MKDTAADGRGALALVGYDYWDGNSWEPTTRTIAFTNGGLNDTASNRVHSRVKVRNVVVKACTYNTGNQYCSSVRH
ncbi:hypothetical protein ACIBCM_31515 [Streptomyces sp. NPDC051018]|uniref:hypothetical protein n=1 Tax=Streptomyces sp. NPDC051018 TaxID=3365639 RepID=UPI00379C0432